MKMMKWNDSGAALTMGREENHGLVTVEAAMRALEAATRCVRQSSGPEAVRFDPALDQTLLEASMRTVWRQACHTRSALVEATILEKARATARELLQHTLELALLDRHPVGFERLGAPLETLAFAAQAALWQLRWTLFDYRKPDSEWVHSLARCHALLRFCDPQDDKQRELRHDAMLALSQCFILVASDPHALSPRELHEFSDALPLMVGGIGQPRIGKSHSGPVAILDRDGSRISVEPRLCAEAPVLYLPLLQLLKLLDAHPQRKGMLRALGAHLMRRLTGDSRRAATRKTYESGLVTIGFVPILGTERQWMSQENGPREGPARVCTVVDYSETGARVSMSSGAYRPQPGQLASLERGSQQHRQLAVVRWIRRENGASLSAGLEFLHHSFSTEVVRSHDAAWPGSGLRVQKAIVAGLQSDAPPESIDVFIGCSVEEEHAAVLPSTVTLAAHDLCFTLAHSPEVLNGHMRLTYRRGGAPT